VKDPSIYISCTCDRPFKVGRDRMDKFSEALSITRDGDRRSFPVEYLGVYDTVKATKGIGPDIRWPYTEVFPTFGSFAMRSPSTRGADPTPSTSYTPTQGARTSNNLAKCGSRASTPTSAEDSSTTPNSARLPCAGSSTGQSSGA